MSVWQKQILTLLGGSCQRNTGTLGLTSSTLTARLGFTSTVLWLTSPELRPGRLLSPGLFSPTAARVVLGVLANPTGDSGVDGRTDGGVDGRLLSPGLFSPTAAVVDLGGVANPTGKQHIFVCLR